MVFIFLLCHISIAVDLSALSVNWLVIVSGTVSSCWHIVSLSVSSGVLKSSVLSFLTQPTMGEVVWTCLVIKCKGWSIYMQRTILFGKASRFLFANGTDDNT